MSNSPFRVLLVAPGPTHSTLDIYTYYRDAMKKHGDIELEVFPYHNILLWQRMALSYFDPNMDEDTLNEITRSRAARELLADIVNFGPDIVFVVAGTALPFPVWQKMSEVRHQFKVPYAIATYFTESPYLDDMQQAFRNFCDVSFVNDLYSVRKFDPNDELHVHYLPHSYNPDVHKPIGLSVPNYDCVPYETDVFFCGTPFYERAEIMAGVNWDGVNLKVAGNWKDTISPEHYIKLQDYLMDGNIIDNQYLVRFYQNTKISLNIHRTRGDISALDTPIDNYQDAYSIGPRIYEAVASGAFMLTDYRKEAEDIFGDTIGYFDGSTDLDSQVRKWLDPKNESERQEKVLAAQDRIKDCTFSNRLDNIILPVFEQILRYRGS